MAIPTINIWSKYSPFDDFWCEIGRPKSNTAIERGTNHPTFLPVSAISFELDLHCISTSGKKKIMGKI
ncbi:hypothetical protein LINPERHAP1_LOCUS24272 [Linum perenne]